MRLFAYVCLPNGRIANVFTGVAFPKGFITIYCSERFGLHALLGFSSLALIVYFHIMQVNIHHSIYLPLFMLKSIPDKFQTSYKHGQSQVSQLIAVTERIRGHYVADFHSF